MYLHTYAVSRLCIILSLIIIGGLSPLLAQQYDHCATMEADSLMRAAIPNAPTLNDFENWLQPKIAQYKQDRQAGNQRGAVITIPVVVHVIHNGQSVGSGENISQAQVQSQIDVLNEDFRRLNANAVNTPSSFLPVAADCEIEFCLALVDPNGNILPEPGIDRVNGGQGSWSNTGDIDATLKPATIWDPTRYLNMWTVDFGNNGLLGYAQFPEGSGLAGMPGGAQNAQTDGVVMRYDAFGRVGNVTSPYNGGRTTTHEVGHWLGLRHIWGDGGCGTDDFVSDTPESDAANRGCNASHVSCNTVDMVQNYMDYTNDACMNIFTLEQKARMQTVMLNSPRRAELLNSMVCVVLDQYTVTGQVRDAANLQGIPQAKVRLINNSFNYEVTCDNAGNFSVVVFEGTYDIYGGQWGYVTEELGGVSVTANTGPIFIDLDEGYYDDFVLDFQWSTASSASTGDWERSDPIGTTYNGAQSNPGDDVPNDYGDEAYVTGNAGGQAGTDDVDNGVVTLTSPVFDLTGYTEPQISYYRWFYNAGGSSTPDDVLTITLTNGTSTVTLETLNVNSPNSNQWNYNQVRVKDFLQPTANMQFVVVTSDQSNSGHLVEGGLDLWRVTDTIINSTDPPVADFNTSTLQVCSGSSVNFSDASTNAPTSWSWSFPGGTPSTSTQQNPSVVYNTPGTYDVTLTATNAFGNDVITKSAHITVEGVGAEFSASVTSGCPGLTVQFSDLSTCNPTSWSWSFPGGSPSTSTQQNPTVVYNTAGTYDVTLNTSNAGGNNTETKAGYITVSLGGAISVFTEDFESGTFNANGWTLENPDNNLTWEVVTVAGSTPGDQAARVNVFNYNAAGQRDGLITPTLNLSAVANTSLSFEHAHRRFSSNESDSLIIYVSTDGGATFPFREFAAAEDGTGSFATNSIIGNTNFVPTIADDWCFSGGLGASCFTVDLSAYDGQNNVKLKFEIYNDFGNNIYVDNIEVAGTCTAPTNTPVASFSANQTEGCAPLSVTFTDQSTNTPTSWNWNFPGGTPGSSVAQNPTVTYNSPGTYDVTLTVSNNDGTDNITIADYITVYANPTAVASSNDASCYAGNDGFVTVSVSGGKSPFGYNWSNGGTTQSLTGVPAGMYVVTVSDDNGCTGTSSATVNEPLEITLTPSSTDNFCNSNNGTAGVTATGGTLPYTYTWSNGQTTATITGLSAGSYTVTVDDANGCEKIATAVVQDNNAGPNVSFTINNVTCFGGNDGSISLSTSGGTTPYSYSWSSGDTTSSLSGLSTGNYAVTISDANGCTTSSSVFLGQAAEILLNATVNDATCGGSSGDISLAVSGGKAPYAYLWFDNSTGSSISGLGAGSYGVTVTDSDGCTKTGSFNVSNQGGPSISLTSTDALCNGGSGGSAGLTINGGTSPFQINWSNGDTTGNISGLTAGTYNVTVTDNNGCSSINSVNVGQPAAINITITVTNAACGNATGRVQTAATGGTSPYTYSWGTGDTTANLSSLSSGTYTLTVTDANGCTAMKSATVMDAAGPTIFVSTTSATCFGSNDGAASTVVSGGTAPYTYSWSSGATTTIASNLGAGAYDVTVTDANGCSAVQTVSIIEPSEITATFNITDATCGNNDGVVSAVVSGGNSPYTYLWSTGQVSATLSNLSSGTYDLTVNDANSCFYTTTVNVSNVGGPILTFTVNDISCFGANDGEVILGVSGGAAPYIYDWSNDDDTKDISNVAAGTYDVVVTDDNGCVSIGSATVSEPTLLELSFTTQNILCGTKTGVIEAVVTGGTQPYTYTWSNGANVALNDLLTAGTYSLTLTDANGCEIIDSASLTGISGLALSLSSTPDTSNNSGTATVSVQGGTLPYNYQWSDGQTTETATGLAAGEYYVTVTDANSCSQVDTVTVDNYVGIYEADNALSLSLYPNPNSGNFVAAFNHALTDKLEWKLYNAVGVLINGGEAGKGTVKLNFDIKTYAEGIYFLRLTDGNNTIVKRVVFTR